MGITLDTLDELAAKAFEGYIVRKDLVRTFSRQYPVPTYVVEFLLGRYCASTDPEEIEEGLQIVSRQLANRTVKAGEEELFKSRAREEGSVKIIDVISARLDAKTDSYLAGLPSLRLRDVRIDSELVHQHERMLTGGFYAEVELGYDAVIAQENNGRPFGIDSLSPDFSPARFEGGHLIRSELNSGERRGNSDGRAKFCASLAVRRSLGRGFCRFAQPSRMAKPGYRSTRLTINPPTGSRGNERPQWRLYPG